MRKADNLPPYRAVVMKSGSLNFLEPSGPAQACYGRTVSRFAPNVHAGLLVRLVSSLPAPCYALSLSALARPRRP